MVFWVVFLGFYLNTKEWKIREGIGVAPPGEEFFVFFEEFRGSGF